MDSCLSSTAKNGALSTMRSASSVNRIDAIAIGELDDDALAGKGDGAGGDEERAGEARLAFLRIQLDAIRRPHEAIDLVHMVLRAGERAFGG